MSRSLPVIMAVVVISILLLGCSVPAVSSMSCQDIAEHWTGEIAPTFDQLEIEILSITDVSESQRVDDEQVKRVVCNAKAEFADGSTNSVRLRYFKDSDGEYWYEFQAVGEISGPTASKSLQSPTPTSAQRATSTPAPTPTPDPFPSLECLDLTPLIIEMMESEADPFVEISPVEKISHDGDEMVCSGVVKTESGLQSAMRLHQDKFGGYGIDHLGIPDTTCEYTVPDVIGASEQPGNPPVLKIYDPEELGRTDSRLDCRGTARTSDGDYSIEFYIAEDVDGDQWVYYERFPISTGQVSPTPTRQYIPTPVAPTPTQWWEQTPTPVVPTPTPDPYVATSNGLRLLEYTVVEDGYGSTYITGVIENPSKTYRSESGEACLYFDLYDSAGYFVGDKSIIIGDSIPPRQKLKFNEYLTGEPFSRLEFKAFKGCWN